MNRTNLREYVQRTTREQEEPHGASAREAVQVAVELLKVIPHGIGRQRLIREKGLAGMREPIMK